MIWSVSIENTAALNTSTSHRVTKLNHTSTLVMPHVILICEEIVILLHDLSQQTLTGLQDLFEKIVGNRIFDETAHYISKFII